MKAHPPRRSKASTYYHRYALTSRQRRISRPGLGLHRPPDLRLPPLHRRGIDQDFDEDWSDEDYVDIPVKVRPLPLHPMVTLVVVVFLIVLGFICMIPLIGIIKVFLGGV